MELPSQDKRLQFDSRKLEEIKDFTSDGDILDRIED